MHCEAKRRPILQQKAAFIWTWNQVSIHLDGNPLRFIHREGQGDARTQTVHKVK
jgi:hypothetical protein